MPVSYNIDLARALIRTTCEGPVTFDEVVQHFGMLVADPHCPGHLDVLLDLTKVTSIPETHHLRGVADTIGRIQHTLQFGACAIVAQEDVPFAIGKMFAAFAKDHFRVTSVFRTLAEAETWLASQQSSAT